MKVKLQEKDEFVYARVNANSSESEELRSFGLGVTQFYIKELISDMNTDLRLSLSVNLDWPMLVDCARANSAVNNYIHERIRFHLVAYAAEIVMHVYLGNDWRLVFKYNERFSSCDGLLKDKTFYDVYTRSKNRYGLSKLPKKVISIYVLTHYYGGLVFLVGYATLDELESGAREKKGCFSLPINRLHQVSFLKSDYRLGLESHVSEERLLNLQAQVC